jgi:hypothetical protein
MRHPPRWHPYQTSKVSGKSACRPGFGGSITAFTALSGGGSQHGDILAAGRAALPGTGTVADLLQARSFCCEAKNVSIRHTGALANNHRVLRCSAYIRF